MHPALYIEKILLNIFKFCYVVVHSRPPQRPTTRLRYANVDFATLARTCKAFKDLALDMIWAELEDLSPLVRCLPETSRADLERIYWFKKRLDQFDWDIILGYARRVRALPRLRGSLGLDGDCIEELSKPPTSSPSVFPNLRVVGLHNPNVMVAPFVRHLANPELIKLSFEHTESLGAAINTFGEQCPTVTNFHVSQRADADAISGLLLRWQILTSVNCRYVDLNEDALSHLSCSGNLTYLAFKMQDAVLDWILSSQSFTPTSIFLALRDLRLASESLTLVWRLFHHLCVPGIHNLAIDLPARPTASDLMSFLAALPKACTRNVLTSLQLDVINYGQWSKFVFVPAPPYYITFDHLRPLAVFANISSIILDVGCGVDLNERELLCLASSWPRLEQFMVGSWDCCDGTTSSALTPGGFVQLLERCRSLRALSFKLDTRSYTEIPQGHPWRGLTMPKRVYMINLRKSPIEKESVEALGVFFHVAPYPYFYLTTHWNKGTGRSQDDLYYDRWVDVRTLANRLWEERRYLRHSLETRFSQRHP